MRPADRNGFEIGIICALTLEADAVEALFDETYDKFGKIYGKQPHDTNAYITGRIGYHDVVLCYLPGMGIQSAAGAAANLRISYTHVQLALVVGICGGVPSPPNHANIVLGDVIISDSVIQFDFGRQYPDGFKRKSDVKETPGRPNLEIRSLLSGLQGRLTNRELRDLIYENVQTLQKQAYNVWRCPDGLQGGKGITKPSVHIGKVASANTVMKSREHRDRLAEKEGVIGFEMEGAGVWEYVPCIIIKGVCDYADIHKNKVWHNYAAATAASGAKAFLEYWKRSSSSKAKPNNTLFRSRPLEDEIEALSIEERSDSDISGDESGLQEHGIQCFSCQGYGHIANDCPRKTCYKCGIQGHYAKTCNRRPGNCYRCGRWGHFANTCWKQWN